VAVNGAVVEADRQHGYIVLAGPWKADDEVFLRLAMETRLVAADYRVEAARGQVAVCRGPLVYCLESPDQSAGVHVFDLWLPSEAEFAAEHRQDLLGGVTVLRTRATTARLGGSEGLYGDARPQIGEAEATLIPYYAWANRGLSRMTVWIPLAL
jgi:DUF1680 family protein